ncbi:MULTISPECIES: hypothetical protein [Microbacterium]|uniref:hypothetical protein n=1 Tax=Microbacterium TaxID=33882 RepID=UPI002789A2DB|nr:MULTISPECIES: hypothetical protein [Microbacterium]MDQ1084684.1 hypothetical protein [Microbacterium sp. SORGH_AS_0344]MDQ1170039.1 hypothetical protein [Microbacterium proteolyticum]
MTGEVTPTFDEVLEDVLQVRALGIGRLRALQPQALRRMAVLCDLTDGADAEPAPIVRLLRNAVDALGGGSLQEAAEYSLGLYPGTALWSSGQRRKSAAEQYGLVAETFRKKPERELLGQVVEAILEQAHDARLRQAKIAMESKRHPADSRLAVQWVERFEAYYRIWTPVSGLAAAIEAAIAHYQDEPLPHLPWDENSEQAYDPVEYARSQAREALHFYVKFLLERKRFISKHGGLWLASDPDTEQAIADAVYRIGWHNDFFRDDEAWLRRQLAASGGEELDHFWEIVLAFPRGQALHAQWQQQIAQAADVQIEEQRAASQPHLMLAACEDYMRLIDAEWDQIADWYHLPRQARAAVGGAHLYDHLLAASKRSKNLVRDTGQDIE